MNIYKNLQIIIPFICLSLFVFVSPAFAAAPDGMGPWADSVFSFHQGLMKNGLPVPAVRSDPTAAVGVAENTPTIDSTFFALGFGGNIVLGFDNGIRDGAMVIESTILPYPDETAKIEMSQDGINWIIAGNLIDSGSVNKPTQITCAKYVRITDTSNPAIMPDAVADGYDVDGVKAIGDPCNPNPTLALTATPTLTQAPIQKQSNTSSGGSAGGSPGGSSGGSAGSSSAPSNSSNACKSSGVKTVPEIISAKRLSPTSIDVTWGPNAGLNDFIVQYGFQNGNWQFNTKISGFSTTITNLPANQSIWIHVAATDNCAIGAFGGAIFVGGPAATNAPGFPNTGTNCPNTKNPLIPCFPNTGSIRLPNTGIDPNINTIFWNIQMDIQYLFFLLRSIKL